MIELVELVVFGTFLILMIVESGEAKVSFLPKNLELKKDLVPLEKSGEG